MGARWVSAGKRSAVRLFACTLAVIGLAMALGTPGVGSDVRRAQTEYVWLLEDRPAFSSYSNGLRIETALTIRSSPRFYQVLSQARDFGPLGGWFSEPAGIVFHLTETSPDTPTPALLNHLRGQRSYNFVIDRMGRTHRLVEELDAANHAGNSVWADGDRVYVNLNNSFLAVAFAARTEEGGPGLTPAQVRAGSLLTQALRSRYRIAAQNCVTHAQVSVNPGTLRVGYHTDGALRFPFAELGLAGNYDLPPAALAVFGFRYDTVFLEAMGGAPWEGIRRAEQELVASAKGVGMDVEAFRDSRRQQYRRLFAAYSETGALEER